MEGWTWHKYRNQLEDVTLHSSVHKFSSAQVVVPVEYVNEEVAEGKDHPVKYKLYFLHHIINHALLKFSTLCPCRDKK